MISSKQRSFLRGLAQTTDPTVYIGKQGLTENIIKEIDTGLYCRELVKVKIQEGCTTGSRKTISRLSFRENKEGAGRQLTWKETFF